MSIITFAAYGLDKSAAINNKWRISEKTLHLFSLICGWPGAAAGQRFFFHKTSKKSFQLVFLLTIAVNSTIFAFIISPEIFYKTIEKILNYF
jgi:uncharacterized membrane protein YsdA (DUF1294 family)